MDKDIGKISKGEYQGTVTDIVVGVKEYNGRVGVDIREFVVSERYTGPTKKGLRIPVEHFKEFKKIINSISDADLKADASAEKSAEKPQQTLDNQEMPDY